MKKYLLIAISILSFSIIYGQDDTYIDESDSLLMDSSKVNGFLTINAGFTQITGENTVIMGGSGAVLFENNIFVGGYGSGMINDVEIKEGNYKGNNLTIGQGGMFVGYIFMKDKLITPLVSLNIGLGGVNISDPVSFYNKEYDNFYVFSPSVEFDINLSKYIKVGIGANYKIITNVDSSGLNNNDFSAPEAFVSIKIGSFGKSENAL